MVSITPKQAVGQLRAGQIIWGSCYKIDSRFAWFNCGVKGLSFPSLQPDRHRVGAGAWFQITRIDTEKIRLYLREVEDEPLLLREGDLCLGCVRLDGDAPSVRLSARDSAKIVNLAAAYEGAEPSDGDLCAVKITAAAPETACEIVSLHAASRAVPSGSLPERIDPRMIILPAPPRASLCRHLGLSADTGIVELTDRIAAAYNAEYAAGTVILDTVDYVRREDGAYDETTHFSFLLRGAPSVAANGAPVFIGMRPSGKKWFVEFAGLKAKGLHKLFFSQVKVDDRLSLFRELAELALPENWTYDAVKNDPYYILESYFGFTYYNVWFRNLIAASPEGEIQIFNTGLVNYNYKPIYCVLSLPEPGQKPRFLGFAVSGEGALGKKITRWIPNDALPDRVEYIRDLNDLFLDPKAEINSDYQHMLIDNAERLPVEMFLDAAHRYELREVEEIVEKLRADDEYTRRAGYAEIRAYMEENDSYLRSMASIMEEAVDIARKRVSWNYKTAVPTYFPARNTVSLLLPLNIVHLHDRSRAMGQPDLALVVSRQPSGNYQGETILTLDMAYLDSRIITRPDSDWLRPESVQAVSGETADEQL